MRKFVLSSLLTLFLQVALIPVQAAAGTNNYLLQSPTLAQAQAVCQRYGFTMVKNLGEPDVYLVTVSDSFSNGQLKQLVKGDADVKGLEQDDQANVPESSLVTTPQGTNDPTSAPMSNKTKTPMALGSAWTGYVQQPLVALINATGKKQATGAGIVAIIDTGVDPHHPALMASLVPGYDFTRGVAGPASELADLNQSTAAVLEQNNTTMLQQSTAAILEGAQVVQLNQSTSAILEQSTAAVLEGQALPAYFGHGTMVAGLVHLIAPTAQIMPLKAFNADGSSKVSDIVAAIYYATDHGANVINMSFSISSFSDEVMRAINYATRHGVICVSSVGNDAQKNLNYPSAFGNVIGVGSTSFAGQRSAFSNFGSDLTTIAAPGEGLITTYPGGHYAAVWGTSFSSAVISGGASLLEQTFGINANPALQVGDAKRAFSQAVPCPTCDLGAGRVDLSAAQQYIQNLQIPPVTASTGVASKK